MATLAVRQPMQTVAVAYVLYESWVGFIRAATQSLSHLVVSWHLPWHFRQQLLLLGMLHLLLSWLQLLRLLLRRRRVLLLDWLDRSTRLVRPVLRG